MTYRPPSGAPAPVGYKHRPVLKGRQALALLVGLAWALAAAPAAHAEPASVAAKRAQAQAVMGQIQGLDGNLSHAIEAYNLANVKLGKIRHDLQENRRELRLAQRNLKRAQTALELRLVQLYTAGGDSTGLEVLVGATSIEDLIERLDTSARVSDQSAQVLREVRAYRTDVSTRRARLKHAHVEQARLVAERASQKASIEGQLAERQRLLSSIRSEIGRLQAAERARQAELAAEARARLNSPQTGVEVLAASTGSIGSGGASPVVSAPPSRYGGVVGIAMRYLGTPYVYGGASPSGFDCSGFIMYVYAQIGVSLPHNAAAQYGYGTPVDKSQLQPGDLVFFNGLGHNGIYIGGGSFIHSPHTGDVVKISSLTGWYSSTWVGARRL
ncbi:MAG: NlpC/P60 family protein [Gaiellaceae bacterium]